MAARFSKTTRTDGFDPVAKFQMVPLSGSRLMSIATDAAPAKLKPVKVGAGNVGIDFKDPRIVADPSGAFPLPSNRRVDFTIRGLSEGLVKLSLLQAGPPGETLEISVKPLKREDCLGIRLADLKRESSLDQLDIASKIQLVSNMYKELCNVQFTMIQFERVVALKKGGLKDPLPLDNETAAIVRDLMPPQALTVAFIVVSAWNVAHNDGSEDLNGRRIKFLEMNFAFVEDAAHLTTYAHEIGHAHELPHERLDTGNIMFTPFTPTREHFDRTQINIVNSGGRK